MIDKSSWPTIRLGALPLGVKVTLTAFLALVSAGYVTSLANIYLHHREADLEPGLGLNDIRRVYHGLEKLEQQATADAVRPKAPMLVRVEPGGSMRKYLERGGEESVRSLIHWLQSGAREEDFTREGLVEPDDPSPADVIVETCVECHNATSGDKSDVPYATDRGSDPTYDLVKAVALPQDGPVDAATKARYLAPTSVADLVQVSHVHIISIPVFVLLVAGLFLLTGQSPRVKGLLGPLPMIAVCLDIGSWWLARPIEPFVYVIGAAGALFGASLGLQIACILGSLWLGRSPAERS